MSAKSLSRFTAKPCSTMPSAGVIMMAGVLLACGGGGDALTATATESVVTLSGVSPATVAVGGIVPRVVTITVVTGSAGALQWSSDNPAVATAYAINATGTVAAGSDGTNAIKWLLLP